VQITVGKSRVSNGNDSCEVEPVLVQTLDHLLRLCSAGVAAGRLRTRQHRVRSCGGGVSSIFLVDVIHASGPAASGALARLGRCTAPMCVSTRLSVPR
jgi:hypothetical protein